jgi:hypothetical protein
MLTSNELAAARRRNVQGLFRESLFREHEAETSESPSEKWAYKSDARLPLSVAMRRGEPSIHADSRRIGITLAEGDPAVGSYVEP